MAALQLALNKIAAFPDATDILHGHLVGFECFALQIQAVVGLLNTPGQEDNVELQCDSHVPRLTFITVPKGHTANLKWENCVIYCLGQRKEDNNCDGTI